jgi:glycine/D-amino acid oxidase-like deaminating enzyme
VPFVNTDIVLGGFYTPSVSVVDSLRAGTIFREQAMELGALKTVAGVEILGIEVEHGRIQAVVTDQGRIEAQYVVIACGVWSPRLAAMAGATIPLTPAVHQMIDVGPIAELEATGNEIGFPIIRDMDTFCLRAADRRLDGGGFLRAPSDLPLRRRHPVDQGVAAVADRVAVHRPTTSTSSSRGARADARHPLDRRDEVRDQRFAVTHARRLPALGETAEVRQPVVGGRGVDQGGPGRRAA